MLFPDLSSSSLANFGQAKWLFSNIGNNCFSDGFKSNLPDSIPAAAQLASFPKLFLSTIITFLPMPISRQAIDKPIIPPPIIKTIVVYKIFVTLLTLL